MTTRCASAGANFSLLYAKDQTNPFSENLTLKDFTFNIGIGSGSSTLDINLLYNGCGNYSATSPTLAGIGRAVTFRCNSLSFGGIVNSSSYSESSGGFIFKLSIIDAKRILENVTVIYRDYYCPISTTTGFEIANLINVLPTAIGPNGVTHVGLEPNVAICPPGEDSENWPRVGNCASFGTSGLPFSSPSNGVQTYKILDSLNGRTVYTTCGEALTLNVSLLASSVRGKAAWSRINGTSSSVLSIIQEACDDIACDFFLELVGTTIVVSLIDRSIEQDVSVLGTIINSARTTGTLISGDQGWQEIYEPSSRVIIGDKVHYIAETASSQQKPIGMFMGYDSNNNPQRVYGNNFSFLLDIRPLRDILNINIAETDWRIREEEIICCGSLQMWVMYGLSPAGVNSLSRKLIDTLNIAQGRGAGILNAFNVLMRPAAGNGRTARENWNIAKGDLEALPRIFAADVNYSKYTIAHSWFMDFINAFYGKQFLVPVNNFCAYPTSNRQVFNGETGQYDFSDFPTDAGYPSVNQLQRGIRGLTLGTDTSLFETSDNKLGAFIQIPSNRETIKNINGRNVTFRISPFEMSQSSFVVTNNNLYMKAQAQPILIKNNRTGFPEVLIITEEKIAALPFFGAARQFLMNKGLRAFATLFGVNLYDDLVRRTNGFSDLSSFNIFQLQKAALNIDFAAVPMKSNIYVYGPWIYHKGSVGSTQVDIKPDLNPWNYGGYATMNQVGSALSQYGIRTSNLETSVSFSLAEPPGWNINHFLTAGIFVENINLTYDGTSGVTTNYSFKTFTSKFGDYGSTIAELVSENLKNRNEIIGYIRKERNDRIARTNNLILKLNEIALLNMAHDQGGFRVAQDFNSPGVLIVGGYWDSQDVNNNGGGGFGNKQSDIKSKLECNDLDNYQPDKYQEAPDGKKSKGKIYEIGLNAKHEIETSVYDPDGFKVAAIMSLDGLIGPVSTEGRGGNLSPYALWYDTPMDRLGESANKLTKSRPSMPPIFSSNADGGSNTPTFNPSIPANFNPQRLPINQRYLNPIVSKKTLNNDWDGRGISDFGFNIRYVSFGTDIKDLGNINLRDQETDFGFSALRGPLVLQSWGYDTENKPIPNIIDSPADAEIGIFNDLGTKNKFMSNWLTNPKTWPVGPIDLRWDRDRGVWVCPPPDRIVVAQLLSKLYPYGRAKAILLNPQSSDGSFYENYGIYGPNGEDISGDVSSSSIVVCDFLGKTINKGASVYALFNDGKYIVLDGSEGCDESDETTTDCSFGIVPYLESRGITIEKPSVIGLDDDGCLTLYAFTECPTTPP